MYAIPKCDLSNFQRDLPNVAIMKSIQADKMFDIFEEKTDFCEIKYISKTVKIKKLKQTPKVSHIFHL